MGGRIYPQSCNGQPRTAPYSVAMGTGGGLAGLLVLAGEERMDQSGDQPGARNIRGRHDVWPGGAGYVWDIHGRAANGA